jgi:hypothetical protein
LFTVLRYRSSLFFFFLLCGGDRGTDGREIKEFDWSVMIIALHILLTIVIFLLEPELELWGDTSPTMNRFRDPSPAAGKSQGEGKEEVGEVHLSESRPSNPQCW